MSSGNALHKLEIKTEAKKVVGANGYFITYDMDRLFMRKLGETKGHCVLGDEALADAKKTASEHLQECKNQKRRFMAPKNEVQLERYFKIFPECIYQGTMGIRAYKATDFPVLSCFRETIIFSYDIKNSALLRRDENALPKACLDRVQKQFNALSKSDQETYGSSRAGKFAHYLITASNAGAKVDVFLTYNLRRFSQGCIIHAGETAGLSPSVEAATSDFLHRHGPVLRKAKVNFARAAPDGTALIYAAEGKLF